MDIIILTEDSSEREYLLNWLATHPINENLGPLATNSINGKQWMYQHSFRNNNEVIHVLVHESHPATNTPVTTHVKASQELTAEHIANILPFKL